MGEPPRVGKLAGGFVERALHIGERLRAGKRFRVGELFGAALPFGSGPLLGVALPCGGALPDSTGRTNPRGRRSLIWPQDDWRWHLRWLGGHSRGRRRGNLSARRWLARRPRRLHSRSRQHTHLVRPPLTAAASRVTTTPSRAGRGPGRRALDLRGKPGSSESGNIVVEFVGVMTVLMVPAIIMILVFSALIGARMAVGASARDAARAYVRADGGQQALARAQAMADLALRERGIDPPARLQIRCSANPCLSPGGTIKVRASATVTLPILDRSAEVGQTRSFSVDEFREVRR